ncbi:MAG TPA: DUF5947 family protein [Kofleriaceae bacterium]
MKRDPTQHTELERCALCASPLGVLHDHFYDPRAREVYRACEGCAVIHPTAHPARYRRIPRRLATVDLDAKRCLAVLGVPVSIVVVRLRDDGRAIAEYPGPAGLVSSEITPNVWSALRAAVPAVGRLEPEVEALLVCSTLRGGMLCGIDVVLEVLGELRARPEAPAVVARMLAELREAR